MDTEKNWENIVNEAIGLEPIEIKIKKMSENAVIPKYAIDGDVGMDLTAIDVEYDEEKDMYILHQITIKFIELQVLKNGGFVLYRR